MILHPKTKNRFRILFDVDYFDTSVLSEQVFSFSGISTINDMTKFGIVMPKNFSVTFEDDLKGRVFHQIKSLQSLDSFKVRVNYFDGNDGIETCGLILNEVRINGVSFDKLDYSKGDSVKIELHMECLEVEMVSQYDNK